MHVVAPSDVPIWGSIALFPGPPLDLTRPAVASQQLGVIRGQESFATWQATLAGTHLPTATAETDAILHGDTDALRSMADTFDAAAITMDDTGDPTGGALESNRLRLSLLVDEEAARTAEAGRIAPATQQAPLEEIAETLAVIGDKLWDTKLGPRATTFPLSLLTS